MSGVEIRVATKIVDIATDPLSARIGRDYMAELQMNDSTDMKRPDVKSRRKRKVEANSFVLVDYHTSLETRETFPSSSNSVGCR